MVAKVGRPTSENRKDYMIRVRMDMGTLEQLDKCCEEKKLSRSEVIRQGIEMQYADLMKK